jgi:hypothetical protein
MRRADLLDPLTVPNLVGIPHVGERNEAADDGFSPAGRTPQQQDTEKQKRLLIVVNNSDHVRQLSINTRETAAEGCTHFVSALKNDSDPNVEPSLEGAMLHVLINQHGFAIYTACNSIILAL